VDIAAPNFDIYDLFLLTFDYQRYPAPVKITPACAVNPISQPQTMADAVRHTLVLFSQSSHIFFAFAQYPSVTWWSRALV
jgi:hypothetical protein